MINVVSCPKRKVIEISIILIYRCPPCMLYLYHFSLVIGVLLHLVGLKEHGLGTRSIGLGWPLSKVGNLVGRLLLQSSLPHNLGMPS